MSIINANPTVVIVGGGSSAWSAAAILSSSRGLNIKVVEPEQSQPIGVGESTLPQINAFHKKTGLSIFSTNKWLDEVDGTAKFSIEFEDFHSKIGSKWIHPFLAAPGGDVDTIDGFIRGESEFAKEISQREWAERNIFLAKMQANRFYSRDEVDGLPSGYHFDAAKYGELLKRAVLTERPNVELINATVEGAARDASADNEDTIVALMLSNGELVRGDYFVDCTGFKSVISTGEYLDYDFRLYCDTALAAQLPYIDKLSQQRNTTHCKGMSSGWVWNVPLQSRVGTGYVYSSRHITQEDAEEEFRDYLQKQFGYEKSDIALRKVDFSPRRKKEPWAGNTISIGLSGFFLEPLESTGLALTHISLIRLLPLIEQAGVSDDLRRTKFNRFVAANTDEAMEFIDAHYAFSERIDTEFWRDSSVKFFSPVQSELFNAYMTPGESFNDEVIFDSVGPYYFFTSPSWAMLFYGNKFQPNSGSASLKPVLPTLSSMRRTICGGCEHKKQILKTDFCGKCKCILAAKTKFESASCPIGLW